MPALSQPSVLSVCVRDLSVQVVWATAWGRRFYDCVKSRTDKSANQFGGESDTPLFPPAATPFFHCNFINRTFSLRLLVPRR
jgi:hypothetical protein